MAFLTIHVSGNLDGESTLLFGVTGPSGGEA